MPISKTSFRFVCFLFIIDNIIREFSDNVNRLCAYMTVKANQLVSCVHMCKMQ